MTTDKKLFFDGKEWKLSVTRNMSFWHEYLSNSGHFHHIKDFGINGQFRMLTITAEGTITSAFVCEPNFTEYTEAVMNSIQNEEMIDVLKQRYELHSEALTKALERCLKGLTQDNWMDFLLKYEIFCAALNPTTIIGRIGSDRLTKMLKEKEVGEDSIPEILSSITFPDRHTPLFQSQKSILQIGEKIQSGVIKKENVGVHLEEWLSDFGYIPVNFCEEPWTMENAKAQLESMLLKDCKKELDEMNGGHVERVKKRKELLSQLNDPRISVLSKAIAEATYLNEFRKNVFSRISLGYRPLFKKLACKAGSDDWRDIFFLTPDESTAILKGEKVDIKGIKASRKVTGSFIDETGGQTLLDPKTCSNFYEYIIYMHGIKKGVSSETFVKGFSACKGKIKGVARIILSSKDFENLKPGEILITTMTSVDFVPVMERSAAFVTNEGGITSHAAIVAREMNKPCIIGTKNATQVIKDGDMVEVDAERGVVRIIK